MGTNNHHIDDHSHLPLKQLLTVRQLGLVEMVANGERNSVIAKKIGTTEAVVKNYLSRIYEAAGCSDRMELTIRYLREQIADSGREMPTKVDYDAILQSGVIVIIFGGAPSLTSILDEALKERRS